MHQLLIIIYYTNIMSKNYEIENQIRFPPEKALKIRESIDNNQ